MARVWTELKHKALVHDAHGSDRFNSFCRDLLDKTDSQIINALDRCKDFTGFFSTPAFRQLCDPDHQALGLPEPEAAFMEACKAKYPVHCNKWSHPAVYQAGADTGWFELRSQSAERLRKVFMAHYAKRVEDVLMGVELIVPKVELLEKPTGTKLSTDEKRAHIAKLRADTGL